MSNKKDGVIETSDDGSYHLKGYDGNLNKKKEHNIVRSKNIEKLKHSGESDKQMDIKFHPIAEIFPMMNTKEFNDMKADIEKLGLFKPIWTYENKIIDGRNRYKACKELGIKPNLKEWKPENGIELIDFVISMNLQRRHLNASQKAMVAADASPYYEKIAKKRQKLSKGRGKKGVEKMPQVFHGKSRNIAGKVFGVSGRYVGDAKKIKEIDPNLAKEVKNGKKSIPKALGQIDNAKRNSKLKKNRKKYKSDNDIKNDIQIVRADFFQWCKENLKDSSIDLVLTEPPNTEKDLPLWKSLAEESARVLKPSGFLVTYCGHRYIDKVVQFLSKQLTYHRLYCIGLNGNGKKHCLYNVIEKWQPAMVYFKPPFKQDRISKDIGKDMVSPNNQLTEKGFSYFMEMLSTPADFVLDPMLGTGAVLRVAKRLNRKFIGIGKDSDCVENAQKILM